MLRLVTFLQGLQGAVRSSPERNPPAIIARWVTSLPAGEANGVRR